MTTVVDTCILLDILLEGSAHGDASAARLASALTSGPVILNEIIAAELAPLFSDEAGLWSTLATAGVELRPYPRGAIYVAGQAFLQHRRGGGRRERILPDFMIAAHAIAADARLLTRDRGFYRKHFPKLRLAR